MITKTGCVSVTEDGVLANSFEFSGASENGSYNMDLLLWARARIDREIANQGYDGLTKVDDDEDS